MISLLSSGPGTAGDPGAVRDTCDDEFTNSDRTNSTVIFFKDVLIGSMLVSVLIVRFHDVNFEFVTLMHTKKDERVKTQPHKRGFSG